MAPLIPRHEREAGIAVAVSFTGQDVTQAAGISAATISASSHSDDPD